MSIKTISRDVSYAFNSFLCAPSDSAVRECNLVPSGQMVGDGGFGAFMNGHLVGTLVVG